MDPINDKTSDSVALMLKKFSSATKSSRPEYKKNEIEVQPENSNEEILQLLRKLAKNADLKSLDYGRNTL